MIYDLDYYVNMLLRYTPTAQKISEIRWNVLKKCFPFARIILDYGSGCGFFKLFAPPGYIVDTFDVGRLSSDVSYPQTGIRHERYDVICLFDVIEHIDWSKYSDEGSHLLNMIKCSKGVLVSLPIKPEEVPCDGWKHYKPKEHLTYFTSDSIKIFFEKIGFQCIYQGDDEQILRKDILTFAFESRI